MKTQLGEWRQVKTPQTSIEWAEKRKHLVKYVRILQNMQ